MSSGATPTRPANIAMVITELADAGAETCLTHLACGLDRSRFTPFVYALAKPPPTDRAKLVTQLEREGIVVQFLSRTSKLEFLWAVTQLRDSFRRDAIDLVHSFLFHANVVSEWARQDAPVPHHVVGVRVAQRYWYRRLLLRRLLKMAGPAACVSQSVQRQMATLKVAAATNTAVIPNGVGLPDLDSLANWKNTFAGRPYILAIARLDHQKGIDLLIASAEKFMGLLPDHELLIVGDGTDRTKLENQANGSAFHERIRFLGWRPEINSLLAQAELFVLPSRWEGMPNVLLQAMACGCPTVCTDVEGVAEVLGPLGDEQLVPREDVGLMSDAIIRRVRDTEQSRLLGEANRQRVAESFSVEAMVNNYSRLFAQVLTA